MVAMFCTISVFIPYAYIWYVPYLYGMYYTRMVQFCMPYAYDLTIRVWYVPYVFNDSIEIWHRATAIALLLEFLYILACMLMPIYSI